MSTAFTSIVHLPPNADFRMETTVLPSTGAGITMPRRLVDPPAALKLAFDAAEEFREQAKAALAAAPGGKGTYPLAAGRAISRRLNWDSGLREIQSESRQYLMLSLDYSCCDLLPEFAPVQRDGEETWLDTHCPIYRTLTQTPTAAPCPERMKLTIIQAENDDRFDFSQAASRLLESLDGRLDVETVRGREFSTSGIHRTRLLHRIFRQSRAVLFLGHMQPGTQQQYGGWVLADGQILTMKELRDFLGSPQPPSSHGSGGAAPADETVPELVVAFCCYSSGSDATKRGQDGLSYPKLFLDAGVRFFVGTAMDVVFHRDTRQAGLDSVASYLADFFGLYAEAPHDTVFHLYEAKKRQQFPLLLSLFQIYSAGGSQATQPKSNRPTGAMILSLQSGDTVGDYRLEEQLWDDALSRTFAASGPRGRFHLVQVLADQLQNIADLGKHLQDAVRRLEQLGSDVHGRHLIPQRYERIEHRVEGSETRLVHALIYDRPQPETKLAWRSFHADDFGKNREGRFDEALRLGQSAAQALADLHTHNLVHGNLDPDSVVVRMNDRTEEVFLKDAWICLAGLRRVTPSRYAAPEELAQGADAAQTPQSDLWGLGIILYELTTGKSPFDEHNPTRCGPRRFRDVIAAAGVPPALEIIVRECLSPESDFRPSAEVVADRLHLAVQAGGNYVGPLEESLDVRIQAGHRLFSINALERDEVRETICALASHPHSDRMAAAAGKASGSVSYRAFVAEPEKGLSEFVRMPGGNLGPRDMIRWNDAAALARIAGGRRQAVALPTAEEVEWINAAEIFACLAGMVVNANEARPVVLIFGNYWWDADPKHRRLLRRFQDNPDVSPVVIVCDDAVQVELELAHRMVKLDHPPPTLAVLFELVGAAVQQGKSLTLEEASLSLELARALHPISQRSLQPMLQMCRLKHGKIDRRLIALVDEERAARFRALGTAAYTPSADLPELAAVALSQDVQDRLMPWLRTVRDVQRHASDLPIPQRLLITGDAGCGKTLLAKALARVLERPLIGIHFANCLSGSLGASETALRVTLASIEAIPRCVVLLDDVGQLFREDDRISGGVDAHGRPIWVDRQGRPIPVDEHGTPVRRPDQSLPALQRMSKIVTDWLDSLSESVIVVSIARSEVELSRGWLRRMQLRLQMGRPDDDRELRVRTFAALFRKFRLSELARDDELMSTLAGTTHPHSGRFVAAPPSRFAPQLFPALRSAPRTGEEIATWIEETIVWHDSELSSAERREFWLKAVDT